MHTRAWALATRLAQHVGLVLCMLGVGPRFASAQDLFELEVFSAETASPGSYEVGLHANGASRGGVAAQSMKGNHVPAHVSVELARGWTPRLETAIFLQSAPFGHTGSQRFAGGHVRAKVGLWKGGLLRTALSAEYSFNRPAFDEELQVLEVRSILQFERGRLTVVANPAIEGVTRGSDDGFRPAFDFSGRAAWRLTPRLSVTSDYFSRPATLRHLQPERNDHNLVFSGLDIEVGPGMELGVSVGHCVTSAEPWLLKSVLGFSF